MCTGRHGWLNQGLIHGQIWFLDEIPKTPTGKVQRKMVAEAVSKMDVKWAVSDYLYLSVVYLILAFERPRSFCVRVLRKGTSKCYASHVASR